MGLWREAKRVGWDREEEMCWANVGEEWEEYGDLGDQEQW